MITCNSIGAHSAGETPVLIPNTEAKPSSGDNTLQGEGSTAPNYRTKRPNRSLFLLPLYSHTKISNNVDTSGILCYHKSNFRGEIEEGSRITIRELFSIPLRGGNNLTHGRSLLWLELKTVA